MSPAAPAPGETRVELLDDVVVKVQSPAAARCEADRTRRGAEVAAATGLFSVPALLAHDEAAGRLVFERVPDIVPIRERLDGPARDRWLDRAAAVLVALHAGLAPGAGDSAAPPALDGRLPPVPLHGDFSTTNVQVQAGTDRLWILDWSAPAWLPPGLGRGAPSFDLAAFVLPLFWQRPGDPNPVPRPEAAAGRFLGRWAAATGQPVGPAAAHILRLQRLRLPFAAARVSKGGALLRTPMQLRCAAWLALRAMPRGRGPVRDD
ncbi:MAG: hypothetical protein H6742_16755 [Alphaproteobacteria bacterium]|nr:hypothetical protein [Alphaproteobacteria bacterium]